MTTLSEWIGRSRTVTETLDPGRSNALEVALGGPGGRGPGDPLPLLHHWLYFWEVQPPARLGPDGHPAKGGFMPPVSLPRRMWAGGRVDFLRPLTLGVRTTRTSTIVGIEEKTGRSGTLVFVTVRHAIAQDEGPALSEEQDLVYRAAATQALPLPSPGPAPDAAWLTTVEPDPVLLFRYSALTLNGHRIHYDAPYADAEERYPALVVHGPLQATLLLRLATEHLTAPVSRFAFRGAQPAFGGMPLHVCGEPEGRGARLWTQQGAEPAMTATVEIASA